MMPQSGILWSDPGVLTNSLPMLRLRRAFGENLLGSVICGGRVNRRQWTVDDNT